MPMIRTSHLRNGAVDMNSETPLSAGRFADQAGADILLGAWEKGVAEHRTVYFAHKDLAVASIADPSPNPNKEDLKE